ncbi:MAG: DEAD/DEAH box helicase, partial [Alphaproteobacteria bacterium]|nr:DEAD/DEAH box helicase [Alphaproteobacteria bacterium]
SFGDQEKILDRGVDVLIATPGRLLDHFERGGVLLNDVKILVIDEADRMLDMGFIPDVERIVGMLPRIRQTLFFSATMPPEIRRLADAFLSNPKEISVSPPASTAAAIIQHLTIVAPAMKREALRRLIRAEQVKNALIFCNRKRDVDILVKSLVRHGLNAAGLHGDMAQSHRTETLERFKREEITFLVCSDVAARGLDISDLSHVFNFDVPIHAEDYVHRIGRTGRAGREGRSFTLATPSDARFVSAIEKLIGKPIPVIQVEGLDAPPPDEAGEHRGRGRRAPPRRDDRPREDRPREDRPRGEHRDRRPRREHAPREEAAAASGHLPSAPAPGSPQAAAQQPPQHMAAQPVPRQDDERQHYDDAAPHRDERRGDHRRGERQGERQRPPRHGRSDDSAIERSRQRREGGRGTGHGRHSDNVERLGPPRHERRPERQPRERHQRDDAGGPPVVGFGDDLPAFLTRKAG